MKNVQRYPAPPRRFVYYYRVECGATGDVEIITKGELVLHMKFHWETKRARETEGSSNATRMAKKLTNLTVINLRPKEATSERK